MKNFDRLLLAAILIITCAVYAPLWSAPALTWDDGSNIFNNPYYTMHLWWALWENAYFGLYVPVTSTLWAGLFWLGGGETWPFRAMNLLLHLANTLLLFSLLKGLAKHWRLQEKVSVALAVGIFALHPLQVQAVAWISGGRDLLATFFALFAAAVYFRWPNKKGYAGATLLFAAALLSKPNTVVIPLAIALIDYFLLSRPLKSIAKRMAVWFILDALVIYITEITQFEYFVNQVEYPKRLLLLPAYARFYVQKLVWPHRLAGNYGLTPESMLAHPVNIILALSFVALFGAAAWLAYKLDKRWFIAGLALVLMLPTSGLVAFGFENISGVADHYMYLPMTAVAAALLLLFTRLQKSKVLFALPLLVIGAWAAASFSRVHVWKSEEAFFTDMAKSAPESYSTAIGMSVVMCEDKKDYNEGLKWIDVALKAKPDDILALANRAFCLLHADRNQEVLDMDAILEKLDYQELKATQPTPYSSLIASVGTAKIRAGEYQMGFQYLCEAYRILPSDPNHRHNLEAAAELLKQKGFDPICANDDSDDMPE